MGWVRANLLTLASVAVVIVITVLLDIPISVAYSVWFIAFVLDASYTFLNRKYVARYELNMLVRKSKDERDMVIAFVKVLLIEYAIMFILTLIWMMMGIGVVEEEGEVVNEGVGVAVALMVFTVVHASAFVRSYMFIRKQMS